VSTSGGYCFSFKSAFNMEAGLVLCFGLAAIQWVKRGIYSNEAGQGTPHMLQQMFHILQKQGLVQSFFQFILILY
jgi:Na+/alanine symporter